MRTLEIYFVEYMSFCEQIGAENMSDDILNQCWTSDTIESIKTMSMEYVSTRVLEKIKNIQEGKTEKWSDVSRHI